MKKKISLISLFIIALLIVSSSPLLARDLAVENYKLAVRSLEAREWEEAQHYLDEVILDDLSQSEFFAKAIYLKSVLLAAKTERNIKLAEQFSVGEERIGIDNREQQKEFKLKAENYKRKARQNVDTIIGLANYLVANLPPLQVNLDYLYKNSGYNQTVLSTIESGTVPAEEKLAQLESDLMAKQINKYLQLTLSVKEFNNLSVIRAREGDNLYDLAEAYEVPFYLMLSANSHIEDPNKIYPGEKIYVPQVTSSYVSYPPYFYYLSQLAYAANPERKQDIMRLVEKAYQLTNAEEATSEEYVRKKSKELGSEMEQEDYKQRLQNQEEKIETQQKELKELRDKYDKLLSKLQKLTSDSEGEEEQQESTPEADDYNPEQDPLTY